MSTTMRVTRSSLVDAVYSSRQRLKVEGYNETGSGFTVEDYTNQFGNAGDVLLNVLGVVVEEEVFEDQPVPFVVGQIYNTNGGDYMTCAYVVEDGLIFHSGSRKQYYWHFNANGKMTGGSDTRDDIPVAFKTVCVGKKKVLKPV